MLPRKRNSGTSAGGDIVPDAAGNNAYGGCRDEETADTGHVLVSKVLARPNLYVPNVLQPCRTQSVFGCMQNCGIELLADDECSLLDIRCAC